MTAGRLRWAPHRPALLALLVALAGCGQSRATHTPDLSQLPLVGGVEVVVQANQCDPGASAFCAIELVIVDRRYKNSTDLLSSEHHLLRQLGWLGVTGDTSDERAAESPGHKLRVTYATADGDLKGIDLGWIQRSRAITLALSRALFDHAPTMSVMLEAGSS